MTAPQALVAYLAAAGLLTITPGLDTMLVLRTAASEGRRAAILSAGGISLGVVVWGAAVALGLGLLMVASPLAYAALTWAGAAYLVVLGIGLLARPRRALASDAARQARAGSSAQLLRRGLLTNLLNPKIGVFYVSFLPQFVPAGWPPGPTLFGLALLHAGLGLGWLSLLAVGLGRLGPLLRRGPVVAWLDRITGAVFVGFGLRLALSRPA